MCLVVIMFSVEIASGLLWRRCVVRFHWVSSPLSIVFSDFSNRSDRSGSCLWKIVGFKHYHFYEREGRKKMVVSVA